MQPDWRKVIEQNLDQQSGQRIRSLFKEINPGLVNDKLFESRWSDIRKDAAVLIPIIDRPEPTVLMTVRSADMPSHAGQISFPGGRVHQSDASRIETALREAEEEIGIERTTIDVVGELGIHEGGLGYSVTPVIGLISADCEFTACPREVEEIFEVPLSFVANMSNHVTEQRVHQGVNYNMFAMPYEGFHVWGLTAGILLTIAEMFPQGR